MILTSFKIKIRIRTIPIFLPDIESFNPEKRGVGEVESGVFGVGDVSAGEWFEEYGANEVDVYSCSAGEAYEVPLPASLFFNPQFVSENPQSYALPIDVLNQTLPKAK